MFDQLRRIAERPKLYEYYTADALWTDPYISQQMLKYHLDTSVDLASRNERFIERSVDWLIERCQLGRGAAVCDFGCGPGLYTTRMAARGLNVTGLDFSGRSLDYARGVAEQQKLEIDYRLVNYLEFDPDRKYDLVTMIFCDFGVLNPEQRRTLLSVFKKCLKPNGRLVIDVMTVNHFEATAEKGEFSFDAGPGFWSEGPHFVFQSTFKYPEQKVCVDKWTLVESERVREIYNWMKCFTPEDLADELSAAGFRISEKFGNVAGDAYAPDGIDMAVVAELVQ